MLKWMGALLLTGGAAGLGLRAAGRLGERVRALRALAGGLGILSRELSFRRAAMPELMGRAAAQAGEPARGLFVRCRDQLYQLGERTFGQIWAAALEETPQLLLAEPERAALYELGEVLGCYGADDQIAALTRAEQTLMDSLTRAEEDRRRLGRVYTALGVGSGVMLTILLL